MNKPNYLLDIPADEYHAATKENQYTTSHRLNLFRRCPALYYKHITGEIVEGDTAAFKLSCVSRIGIFTVCVARENTSSDTPFASLPITSANFFGA
jgi:hypothetical protein